MYVYIYNVYIFIYIYIYTYVIMETGNNVWKQCALPVITTMVCGNSCAQVHDLPQSHCGDNREGKLFS